MDTDRLLNTEKTGLGFGRSRVLDSVKIRREKRLTNEKELSESLSTFISSLKSAYDYKMLEKDVSTAEKIIVELDDRYGVSEHSLWGNDNDINCEGEPQTITKYALTPIDIKLLDCLAYLREEYFYCLYCGCTFDDEDDLRANCPGEFRIDH